MFLDNICTTTNGIITCGIFQICFDFVLTKKHFPCNNIVTVDMKRIFNLIFDLEKQTLIQDHEKK